MMRVENNVISTLSSVRIVAPTPPSLLGVGKRDRRILALARQKLGATADFREVVRALRESVEESIPAGRLYMLAMLPSGPVVGSLVTGVGVVELGGCVELVRVDPNRAVSALGAFFS
jgi:hypothetical protein